MQLNEFLRDWHDRIELPKGAVIFKEGEVADYLYVVLDGEVELTLKDEPLAAEISGGVFGEMALVEAKRSANAITIKPSVLARIDKSQFRELVRKEPDFAIHIIAVVANRLQVTMALAMVRI